MQPYQVTNDKWLIELIEGLDRYLDGMNSTLISQDFGLDEVEIIAPITRELYCGCQDCVRRETLAYLIPTIIEGYKDGMVMEL